MAQQQPNPAEGRAVHHLFREYTDVWGTIEPYACVKAYQKSETILHHGDKAESLWLVLSGWVKLVRQTPDGEESIIGLCTEGDVFGEAAFFIHSNYPYHAETVTDGTELIAVPAEVIRNILKQNAWFSASLMSLLNERVHEAQLKLEHMSTLSATQRLGCFLLRLCRKRTGSSRSLKIPVEKHLIASYLGMKPETYSRCQQQLKSTGVEVNGHEITIHNIDSLREFVCNSCSESGSCEAETDD